MGNRKGHSEAQTMDEMIETMTEARERGLSPHRGQSIYKEKSAEYQTEKLKELVSKSISEVAEFATREKVALKDLVEVQKRSLLYLRACEETGTFPSSLGLARSLGYSDRALRHWRSKQSNTPTARWLEMFNDVCADIISQSALKNNANSIVSIFLSKSLYGLVESNELVVKTATEEFEEHTYSPDEIRSRYLLDESEGE